VLSLLAPPSALAFCHYGVLQLQGLHSVQTQYVRLVSRQLQVDTSVHTESHLKAQHHHESAFRVCDIPEHSSWLSLNIELFVLTHSRSRTSTVLLTASALQAQHQLSLPEAWRM
jgi:hypothetical protein